MVVGSLASPLADTTLPKALVLLASATGNGDAALGMSLLRMMRLTSPRRGWSSTGGSLVDFTPPGTKIQG
jgi:hypothetical protein